MAKHYLDRDEFHNELAVCKKAGELSKRGIKMFQLLAENVARDYYFPSEMDKEDAEARAVHDCWKYWRNFKESNVVQLKFNRQPLIGESIVVVIHVTGGRNITLKYKPYHKQIPKQRYFMIDKTLNYTLQNMMSIVNEQDNKLLEMFLDKVKRKITLMDKHNSDDLSIKSSVTVNQELAKLEITPKDKMLWKTLLKTDKVVAELIEKQGLDALTLPVPIELLLTDEDKKTGNEHSFKKPPNAFSYFTSMVRNAVLKSINEVNPKEWRNGGKISIDGINSENNGMYNF